ncbi:hypothetical protein GGF32_008387 [Allomyces javanicus]|nr:hypothetical protein GGF32_008387 [Allomyces javanicus]
MYAHDTTPRPRVSSRLAPQFPARVAPAPASPGSASPTPAGSRPDSPTKKPATRRPVGAGLLDPVAEVRSVNPVTAVPDQVPVQAQSPPPLPAPRSTSPLPTSFPMSSLSPITTTTSPRARAPTSLSPAHASSSGGTRRHASVAGDHYLPHRASSGTALIPMLTATPSIHQTHARTDSFQSTTSSAASAAPSTRTTASSAAAFTAIGRSGMRRARKLVAHLSDGASDRRTSGPVVASDGLLESYRLRGAQLHAEAQGLATQLRAMQRQRDEARAQLLTPTVAAPTDRAEARRRDRDLRAHLAAATAAAKRGELVLADVQADVDARLEAVANRMAAETVRAKVLEMQVRSFGLAPASEVPGVFEGVEVGGEVGVWRKMVEHQAREIDEGAARWWVAMHEAEVAHARAVAELAEFVLVQAGGKPKEIRRGEIVDPAKMLARVRKEREADEARWKEEEAAFKLEQEEKAKERAKNETGVDETAGSGTTEKGARTKMYDSAQGDDLPVSTTTGPLTAGNSTDVAPAQDVEPANPMASALAARAAQLKVRATAPAAAANDDEPVSPMAMALKAAKLTSQAPAAPAADSKAPILSSTTEPRAVAVSNNGEPGMALQATTLKSRSSAAPTGGDSKPTTTSAPSDSRAPNAESAASVSVSVPAIPAVTAAPQPAVPSSPARKPLPIPPRVTDPILQALDPGFKTATADAPTVAKSTSETVPKAAPDSAHKANRPVAVATATTVAPVAKPPPIVTKPADEPVPVTKPAAAAVAPAAKSAAPAKPAAVPVPRVSVDDAVRQTALLAHLVQAKRAGGGAAAAATHAAKPAHAPKPAAAVKPVNSAKVAPAPVEKVELPPLAPVEDVLGAGFLDLDLDLGFGLGFDAGGLMGDM